MKSNNRNRISSYHFSLIVYFLIGIFSFQISLFSQQKEPVYKNKSARIEDRVDDLINRMTLEEKILQLNQWQYGRNTNENNREGKARAVKPEIGSLIYFDYNAEYRNLMQKRAVEETRLGIPILFAFDVIHGYRTTYPIPLAQACSWNPDLVKEVAKMAAKEAKLSGINWTFAPMIDVSRDPRWGRVAESYGEDPFTNAVFGAATVKGFQGESLNDPYSIAACLKHYVGYGKSEGGRDYNHTDISDQSLWETYLIPYKAGVEAGAATVMSGFNDLNGVPATANHFILTEILKNSWGFKGFIVSDWEAIWQLRDQGVSKDDKESCYKAFMAGVEMDMADSLYAHYLKELVNEKRIPMKQIDSAVKRVLYLKFILGLFENPYTPILPEPERFLLKDYLQLSEKLAEETMVLLKNKESFLPVKSTVEKIAIIGPVAKDSVNILGSWSCHGMPEEVETIYEGLQKEFRGKVAMNYSKGCDFDGTDEGMFHEAFELAKASDIIILCLGEKKRWTGENAQKSSIALPDIQEKLMLMLHETGKPIVLVLSNGRPLELARLEPLSTAIIEFWQPGIAGGSPLAGIISGRINPSGKLSVTFPYTTGQIPTYLGMRQSARPIWSGKYLDIQTEPLYWFGHGLSYSNFQYGELKLSSHKIKKGEKLRVEIEVSNVGDCDGKETVFWFISDPVCSVSRPIKELKYFEKKEIKKNQKVLFSFEIVPEKDLSYVDHKGKRFIEPGEFIIRVGDKTSKFELE